MREGRRGVDTPTREELKLDGLGYLLDKAGYKAVDGDPLDADVAFTADEVALLWAALDAADGDDYRDYGRDVVGVPDPQPAPASTTLRLIASPGTEGSDRVLRAGQELVLAGTSGDWVLVVTADTAVPAAGLEATGVVVEAPAEQGSAPNGQGASATTADGTLTLATPPAWLAAAELEAPLSGGTDPIDDDAYEALVKLEVLLDNGTPTHLDDLELAARTVPGCHRMLAVKGLDLETGETDQPNRAAGFPIDEDGEPCAPATGQAIRDRCLGPAARLICTRELHIGRPTYTRVDVPNLVVTTTNPEADLDLLAEAAADALRARLSPGRHALPRQGEVVRWVRGRTVIRRGELFAEVNLVPDVDECTELELTGTVLDDDGTDLGPAQADDDGGVLLAGHAGLPRPGTIQATAVYVP